MTPLLVFCSALGLYAATLYPSLAPRDAADLARAALTLGVAHPPGYPLYALLGRAWLAALPLGAEHYRLNLMSAVAGALAAALLAAWGARRGRWAGWAGGLSLALCAPLWKFSLLGEMYALQASFAMALLLLAQGRGETFTRRAALSGLLLGLGLVNHQSISLLVPSGLWLWHAEARKYERSFSRFLRIAVAFLALGLMLYAAVPIRLHDLRLGLAVIGRAEYGTLTLFSGFSAPLSEVAPTLLKYWAAGWVAAGSPTLLVAGLAGFWALRRSRWAPAAALGVLAAGPIFFLLTRFDVSNWVARSALEPAFLLSTLWLCVGATAATAALEGSRPWAAAAVCAALAAGGLWSNAARNDHRDDFSAADYARNLRRTLPPDSAAVVQGDTALFSLQLKAAGREVSSSLEPGLSRWAAERRGRPLFAVGLPVERAALLGTPAAAGLALSLDGRPWPQAWSFYAIRRGGALERGESYARDARLSYAFARHSAARLAQAAGRDGTLDAVWAGIWDPEDFQVEITRTPR